MAPPTPRYTKEHSRSPSALRGDPTATMASRRPKSAPYSDKGNVSCKGRGGGGDKGSGKGSGKGNSRGSGRGSGRGSSRGERVTTTAVPLRLLCLHGGRQTGEIFRERLDGLCRRCRSGLAELIFLDGPHELLLPGDTTPTRAWMTDSPTRLANPNPDPKPDLNPNPNPNPDPNPACRRRSTIWSSTGGELAPALTASSASRRARPPPPRWPRAPADSPASASWSSPAAPPPRPPQPPRGVPARLSCPRPSPRSMCARRRTCSYRPPTRRQCRPQLYCVQAATLLRIGCNPNACRQQP